MTNRISFLSYFSLLNSFLLISSSSSLSSSLSSLSSPSYPSYPSYPLPSLNYEDLLSPSQQISQQVVQDLISLGGIQILNIPNFEVARKNALSSLGECLRNDPEAMEMKMSDGKFRKTIAVENIHGLSQEMTSSCGIPSNELRSIIDSVAQQLFTLLDSKTPSKNQNMDIMSPYHSFRDLIQSGDHLEHLHAYFSPKDLSISETSNSMTMNFHTDAGLFIAMTSGFYNSPSSNDGSQDPNGLLIQLPSGRIVECLTDSNSLIIMIGQGGADWLAPVLGASLRPLPHALRTQLSSGLTRSWYGKMYLPPSDALLSNDETYGEYRLRELAASVAVANDPSKAISDLLPSACGVKSKSQSNSSPSASSSSFSQQNLYQQMIQNTLCDGGNGVYCWQQCVPLSDYSCGNQAECIDLATNEPVNGTIMCPSTLGMSGCEVQCLSEPSHHNDTKDEFCWGVGVSMYMDGFTSLIHEKKGETACLNLFFKDWTLDHPYKYSLGCIAIFLLGIVVEVLSAVRRRIYQDLPDSVVRDVLLVLLHCTQTCLSYFLMLAAMTYNVELFCMVLIGVGTGHLLFNLEIIEENGIRNDLTEPMIDTKAYGTYKQL